ncbi:Mo25-like protein [Saitozyma sp. JCM 24511]|nr:Mo25-like protein [Saitozyma sp. JCM 24511]
MNFFNRQKTRSPGETVRALRESVLRLDQSSGEARKRISEEVSRLLASVKTSLSGDAESDPSPDVIAMVANEVYASDLLSLLVIHMDKLEFEASSIFASRPVCCGGEVGMSLIHRVQARKDSCQIYNTLLRRQIGSRSPTVEYISNRPDIIFATLKGYANPDIALNTGMILKEMLRFEPLARILLFSDQFFTFPQYIENTTFGISCDAFANLKASQGPMTILVRADRVQETLTRHKPMVAQWLDANYDRFFAMYNTLILSSNYVTKRQSLKLLGEILLDRANYAIMTRYIANDANLKMMMNFLRDKSRNIQFEAFHVFKVFVANPNKPPQIASILRRNKDRLLVFLKEFHNDKDVKQL